MGLLVCQHWYFSFLSGSFIAFPYSFLSSIFLLFFHTTVMCFDNDGLVFEVCDFAFCFVSVVVL